MFISMKDILVSIITVCYNSEKTIEKTIQSVLNQTYKNIEYIVVDGKSTDSTLEIVKKYQPLFQGRMTIISEPDTGIYDAMNKGIRSARGELIGIINSDDWYEYDAVQNMVSAMKEEKYQILYGMVRIIENDVEIKVEMQKHENLLEEMLAHPTCFVTRKTYMDFGMFDTKYRSCADHDFMLKMRKHSEIKFVPVYKIIASFSKGIGMSAQATSMMEAFGMLKEHGIITVKQYRLIKLSYLVKKILKFGRK